MNKITFENIVQYIINEFPDFTEYDKGSLDIQHVILGNFADFIVEKIESNEYNEIVEKAVEIINKIFQDSLDTKLMDLFQVEVFENFAQSEKAINFSRSNLKGKAIEYFEKAMNHFGIEGMRLK
jgi:hypothetical protein